MKRRITAGMVLVMALVSGGARAHDGPAGNDTTPRFLTSRTALDLPLPTEEDAFVFAIFGDRTGGPPEGVKVLAQAVHDVNLIGPDLVMTVGDLVEGYNTTNRWMAQMREFRGIMDGLTMPWFPVAGNHDIYWRGPGKPAGEHEADYETHFGPLWYAFEHKNAWFIVLFSDESDPETGVKDFNRPASQRMSPEQFAWLESTLARTAGADHVFAFLHHPRWLGGNYGDDWKRVHRLLASAGNVSAVFAGHIHRMRYDGTQDGIEYVTLATTGGVQPGHAPSAGYLHHFHLVTVRPDRISLAALPVGDVVDVRSVTGEVSTDAVHLARLRPTIAERLEVARDGAAEGMVRAVVRNPVERPIDVTVRLESADTRWRYASDHDHAVIAPGGTREFSFRLSRSGDALDDSFRPAEVVLDTELLAEGARFAIPAVRHAVPLLVDLAAPKKPRIGDEAVLALDGRRDCLRIADDLLDVPQGPLTLECWFKARSFGKRTGLVTKSENSEYGIFVSGGVPSFSVFLDDRYVKVASVGPGLETGRWHHVAGVFDGRETRLYVNGHLVTAVERAGERRTNTLPLLVGADIHGSGAAMSHFNGWIDGVRLSTSARYRGAAISPKRRPRPDGHTTLLLNMDGAIGPWLYDESRSLAHPEKEGAPVVERVR